MQNENFKPIKNPYIVGNPIKTKEMFFGRNVDFSMIQEWITSDGLPVILLIGSRRSGKTSMLMQIKNGRMEQICESVLFDCNAIVPRIKKDADFSNEIGKCILSNKKFEAYSEAFYQQEELSSKLRLKNLVNSCVEHISPKKLVILFDEIESLEKVFEDSILTRDALTSINDILTKPVFFIMTSSGGFSEKNMGDVFGHITQQKAIYELSLQDTSDLIRKPVEGFLDYEDDVVNEIYRLSGGKTFFTQHICHTIVNHTNAEFKKNTITMSDFGHVVDFIINNPVGHIQETWKKYSDLQYYPKNTLHFLACLAASIKNSDEFVSRKTILQTMKDKNFKLNIKELNEILALFKKNSRLIEWSPDGYRFRIDLMRNWIAHYYQTGEDVDEYLKDSIKPEKVYFNYLMPLLKKDTITYQKRSELDELGHNLNLSYPNIETIERNLRDSLKLRSINWIQEYQSSCLYIKSHYSEPVLGLQIKGINKTYIDTGRVSKEEAKKIRDKNELPSSSNKLLYTGASLGLAIITGALLTSYSYYSGQNITHKEPVVITDTTPIKQKPVGPVQVELQPVSSTQVEPTNSNKVPPVKQTPASRNNDPRIPPEIQKFKRDIDKLLEKTNVSFQESIEICSLINEKMNGVINNGLRELYIKSLQRSLDLIPKTNKKNLKEKYTNWLEAQRNNISGSSLDGYKVKNTFKKQILKTKNLYGSLEIMGLEVTIDVTISGNDSVCNQTKPCKTPLNRLKTLSGNKVLNFRNTEYSINKVLTIDIQPNQEYILGLD